VTDGIVHRRLPRTSPERAQATVEVVLVLPFVVLVVAAVLQVSVVVRDRIRLGHVAREAARTAMVDEASAAVEHARSSTDLDPTRLTVTVQGGDDPGDRLVVTVRYRMRTDVAMVGPLLPDVTIEERLVTRRE
jgi:hypothetical protein